MKYSNLSWSVALITLIMACLYSGRAANVTVTMSDFSFSPASITIGQGDTVTWTNLDDTHTSTSGSPPGTPDMLWDSGTTTNSQSFSLTFSNFPAQSYPYFCGFHFPIGMVGTVIVTNVPKQYFVKVLNFSFTPASLSIGQGDTVTWTNGAGLTPHTSTSGIVSGGAFHPDNLWGGNVTVPGFSVTFNNYAPRSYPYFCQFHGVIFGMVGSLTVTNGTVIPPILTNPFIPSSGIFQATINGLVGLTNVVQFSPNAVAWSDVNTNLALSTSYQVTNSTDTTTTLGVYRVRVGP
jgi:plastocyanin